jgi:hypothetical protein
MKSFFHCKKCNQDTLEYEIDYHCGSCNPDGPDYIVRCKYCDYDDIFEFDKLINHIKELEKKK